MKFYALLFWTFRLFSSNITKCLIVGLFNGRLTFIFRKNGSLRVSWNHCIKLEILFCFIAFISSIFATLFTLNQEILTSSSSSSPSSQYIGWAKWFIGSLFRIIYVLLLIKPFSLRKGY